VAKARPLSNRHKTTQVGFVGTCLPCPRCLGSGVKAEDHPRKAKVISAGGNWNLGSRAGLASNNPEWRKPLPTGRQTAGGNQVLQAIGQQGCATQRQHQQPGTAVIKLRSGLPRNHNLHRMKMNVGPAKWQEFWRNRRQPALSTWYPVTRFQTVSQG